MKPDDCSLSDDQLKNVREHVRKLLYKADAMGVLPTPVDHIVRTAGLVINNEISLDTDQHFLDKLRDKIDKTFRAPLFNLKKILGLLHVPSGEIMLDKSQHKSKQAFIKLHETGHDALPHQRAMYQIMEDGEFELNPDTDNLFEREANNFAAEALFQLDEYEKMAADYELSIKTPMDLAKTFGSSKYASLRRYVRTHFAELALVVYNKNAATIGNLPLFEMRRAAIFSNSFLKKFGATPFPKHCTIHDFLGSIMQHAKLQTHHKTVLKNLGGELYDCAIHIFNNSYEIFLLFIPQKKCKTISLSPLSSITSILTP